MHNGYEDNAEMQHEKDHHRTRGGKKQKRALI